MIEQLANDGVEKLLVCVVVDVVVTVTLPADPTLPQLMLIAPPFAERVNGFGLGNCD